jgi:hypothetical protein
MRSRLFPAVSEVVITARGAFFALALLSAGACVDSTAPIVDPPVNATQVLPALTDARLRLVPAIENLGVRDRIAYDLLEMEKALQKRDGQRARYHVRIAGGILLDYRAGLGGVVKDGADVGGIALAVYAVSVAAGGTFDIGAFR